MKSAMVICLMFVLPFISVGEAAISLPKFNASLQDTSIGGLSSGAYMSVQMHVAYSDVFRGVAIFAGGPYHCADGLMNIALTTCMTAVPVPDIPALIVATGVRESTQVISSTKNLAASKVYLFSGLLDTTVNQFVMNSLLLYYKAYVNDSNILYVNTLAAAHTQPTDDPEVINPCTLSVSPYISNCGYDGAGAALLHIYGNLRPRQTGPLTGKIIEFDQTEFISNPASHSMATVGYAYVPESCANGVYCRIHVSLHGCAQGLDSIGDTYVMQSGYNKWADTNDIIVLYPQAIRSLVLPYNPQGCWDWWGYVNPLNYDTRDGIQTKAIRAMIDRLVSNA